MLDEAIPNDPQLLRLEVERYKNLYEQEREQFLEFQRCSKELETELDMELDALKKKASEAELYNRKLGSELESVKSRYEKERQEFLSNENLLRSKLSSTEESCKELKQKLRRVEQLNDDLERRERIQAQEILDWANRYEKCLERCAYLEAGIFGVDEESELNSPNITTDVLADRTNIHKQNLNNTANGMMINNTPSNKNGEMSPVLNSLPQERNGFHGIGSSLKKSFFNFTPHHNGSMKERPSSAIVTSLFRKIEEVEKQVDPKKYVIHRTPNRNNIH